MRVGLSTATFFGKSLTEDSINLVKECGCDVCEVFLTTFYEYEPEFARLLLERKGDLEVHSVHTLTNQFEPQLTNEAERTRTDAYKIFEKALHTLDVLGGKYYTFHGASMIKKSQRNINFPVLGPKIAALTEFAAQYGKEVCFENVHWAYYHKPGFFTEMKKYAPKLRACLDIKQAMQGDTDYREFIKDMGEDIRTVHICDYIGEKLYPTGFGGFDFSELKMRLQDAGYNGDVFIELYSRDYDGFDTVRAAVDKMKNIFEK